MKKLRFDFIRNILLTEIAPKHPVGKTNNTLQM